MTSPRRPPLGARLWHVPSRQWVEVVASNSTVTPLDEEEVKVEFVNLPGSEMVVKVASLREQP